MFVIIKCGFQNVNLNIFRPKILSKGEISLESYCSDVQEKKLWKKVV